VWWVIGGVLIAAAVARWVSGRPGVDQSERVQRAFAAVHHRRRVAIAAAEEGAVLIRGKVSARDERLTSPLTQRACVFYDVRIDNLMAPQPSRHSDRLPSTVMLHQRDARPFLVTDETGTALVAFDDLADVSFVVDARISLSGRELHEATAIHSALGNLGFPPFGRIAVDEAAIFVGDEVEVAGLGRREVAPDGEPAGRRSPPTRYVVRAGADALLAILKRKR
jgi:hypothetical protein